MTDTRQIEQAIIGSMLIDRGACTVALGSLQTVDFASDDCRVVYEAIRQMAVSGKGVDIVSVQHDTDAPLPWLVACTDMCLPSATAQYCATLAEQSTRRRLFAAGQQIAALARSDTADGDKPLTAAEIQGMAVDMLMQASPTAAARTTIQEIVPAFFAELERDCKADNTAHCHYGMGTLDRVTGGMRPGELTIVAARPSVGKTACAVQWAWHNASRGRKVLFYTLEMSTSQIMQRFTANETKVRMKLLRNPKTIGAEVWRSISAGGARMMQSSLEIIDRVGTIEEIMLYTRQRHMRGDVRLVVVDYLGLCRTQARTAKLYEQVSYVSRQLKLLAKDLNVPVMTLAQLNRENAREGRPPRLFDLRDSGSIEQDADVVLLLHDPKAGEPQVQMDEDAETELKIIVAKNRSGIRDVMVDVAYYKGTQRLIEKGA
jgi:replicative DNA helicase